MTLDSHARNVSADPTSGGLVETREVSRRTFVKEVGQVKEG